MATRIGRPPTVQDGVFVKTLIPRVVDTAINSLVSASGGLSKRALLRQALYIGLQSMGVIEPSAAESLQPTPTPKGRIKK